MRYVADPPRNVSGYRPSPVRLCGSGRGRRAPEARPGRGKIFLRLSAMMTINKRQKEKQRQEKQRDKEQKRQQRRGDKGNKAPTEPGIDPDIAGIVPGPQPLPEGFEDEG